MPVASQAYTDQIDGCEINSSIFVASDGDTAELLDPIEETLDEIALAVEPGRKSEALPAVGTVGNIRPDVPRCRILMVFIFRGWIILNIYWLIYY